MEIRYLMEFASLAEILNYSQASEELLISQSSLSKHIISLEKELGGKLFNRTTHHIELTDFGRDLLPHAKQIKTKYEDFELAVREYKRHNDDFISIGVAYNPNYYRITEFLLGFRKEYPYCAINAVEMSDANLMSELAAKKYKLITTAVGYGDAAEYPFTAISKGYIVAVASCEHKFASRSSINISELQFENVLLPERSSVFNSMIRKAFKTAGVTPNIIYEGSSLGGLDLSMSGCGVYITAIELVAALHRDDYHYMPVTPEIRYKSGLMYRTDLGLSKWEKRFISYVQKYEVSD